MTAQGHKKRGQRLLRNGLFFADRAVWLHRALAPAMRRVLDRIDKGIVTGSLLGHLPDGRKRLLGDQSPGFKAEVMLHDWRGLARLATYGSIGWYQAWEAGEWSSPDPVTAFALIGANASSLGDAARAKGLFKLAARWGHVFNRNDLPGAERNIAAHYGLGNDFYSAWLDPDMTYSSACFDGVETLEEAQTAKWQRLSQRIDVRGKILEIGCGWGGLAHYLSQKGAQVTAISISDEQLEWARAQYPQSAEFRKQDYRDVAGEYDAIVSVEMIEAIGRANWPSFVDCIADNLKPGGRAALQYISMADEVYDDYAASADFIQAYIFPGGLLIRTSELRRLARERGLEWQDQVEFGADYARTLQIWRARFDAAVGQKRLPVGFDDRFIALWRYYLDYCEGGFRAGLINVHQVTLVKK